MEEAPSFRGELLNVAVDAALPRARGEGGPARGRVGQGEGGLGLQGEGLVVLNGHQLDRVDELRLQRRERGELASDRRGALSR